MFWWAVAFLNSLLSQLPQVYNLHTISLTLEKQKSRSTFQSSAPRLTKQNCALRKVTKLRPFVLLVRETCRCVLSIGDNTLTRKNRCTQRKTCPIDTMPTTNPTWTGLRSNPGLGGDRPATDSLSLMSGVYYISGFNPYRAVNTFRLSYRNQSVNAV
jgi:hypothetical protein